VQFLDVYLLSLFAGGVGSAQAKARWQVNLQTRSMKTIPNRTMVVLICNSQWH